jgi:hypothetical protein
MSSSISRIQAKHRAMLAQGAAVLLLVGGVALGITGLPEQSTETSSTVQPVGTADPVIQAPVKTVDRTAPDQIHISSIAHRLSMVDNAPDLPVQDIEDEPPTTIVTQTPQGLGNIVKRLRYIGYVGESGSNAAFVRLDGSQRIVREGGVLASNDEFLGDLTVKTIRPNYIIATDGEVEGRVDLGQRSGQSITMASGDEITPSDVKNPQEELEYDRGILGDPNKVPQHEMDRRKRQLEKALRGQNSRSDAARLEPAPVNRRAGIGQRSRRNENDD